MWKTNCHNYYRGRPDDPEWVEKVAEITGAVSGDTYVKLDHGILTVNQIDMFLKAMPFELTYADDNNQFLYYNNAHQDPDTMFAKRVPPQSGSRVNRSRFSSTSTYEKRGMGDWYPS